jgi:Glycosyl hydrolase family 1
MKSGWHVLDPEVMYWAPRQVQSIWGATSSYITENGCAADDVVADDGRVYDTDRVMFMRACLGQLQRATAEGVPVDGYFYWSSQDNLEWNAGFGNRFGIVYVDFETLARTPSSAPSGSGRQRATTRWLRRGWHAARTGRRRSREPQLSCTHPCIQRCSPKSEMAGENIGRRVVRLASTRCGG